MFFRVIFTSSTAGTPGIPSRIPLVEGVIRSSGNFWLLDNPSEILIPQNSRSPFSYERHIEPVIYWRAIASTMTGLAF